LKAAFHAGAWGSDHLFKALNAIGGARIPTVEVYADIATVYADRADEFVDILQKTGLTLAGAYGGGVFTDPEFRDADVASARATARWLREAGGEVLILQGGEPTEDPRSDLGCAEKTADAIGNACREEGVRFCFQPHMGTVVFKEDAVRAFFARTDAKTVGICLDTGHLGEAGIDPVPFVVEHGQRIRVVHLRDLRPKPVFVGGPFANAGKGTLNLATVLGALKTAGFEGWLVGFADDPREDPGKSARDFASFVSSKFQIRLP
jgi:inosose dehydratase